MTRDNIADQYRDRGAHATLTGRAVRRADQSVHHLIEIGVRHHDHMILGATQGLHSLALAGAFHLDISGDVRCDTISVVGPISSNSNRLREIVEKAGYRIS